MSLVIGTVALFIFALFDYFGFSYYYPMGKEKFYRILQGSFQIILSVICFISGGIKAVIIFNLLWWTWIADWVFYFYCLIFNYRGSRKGWLQPFKEDVRWAFWTPAGLIQLLFKGKEKVYISENDFTILYRVLKPIILVIQSVIGICVAVFIYIIL